MQKQEFELLQQGYESAMCFGLAIVPVCKELLHDYGYAWTCEHDQYVYDNFVKKY